MNLAGILRWHTDSRGVQTLRGGVLALLAAAALALCGVALKDAVYEPMRELPGKWVDGHFQSEPFWIAWRASGYVIGIEVPDSIVPTQDSPVDSLDRHFTQRCGQPFPDGVTWSVRHFGRVIAGNTGQRLQWCEDPSLGHALRAEIGGFRAWPGTNYTVRIEAPRWASVDSGSRLPLRLSVGSGAGADSNFGVPAISLFYFLVALGFICLPLGAVLMVMEHFHILDRLEDRRRSAESKSP